MSDTIKVLPPRARKPSLKRRLQSDEEDAAPPKRAGSGTKAKRLRTHSEEATTPVDESVDNDGSQADSALKEDMDVDIEGDMQPASQRTDSSALSTITPSSSRTALATSESSTSTTRVRRKATKRAVVSSDEDSADEYDDAQNDNPTTEKDKDDDDEWDAPTKSKAKQKDKEKEKEPISAGGIVVKGKGILSTKIPKKRTTKDDKPLIVNFRDESKSSSSALASPSADSPDVPSKSTDSAKPGAAGKRKLPNIQKKKATAEASSQPAHGDPNIFGFNGFRAKRFCEKQGHADVDLSNSSLYAELFKGTSSTKATNARVEARRKELNRMRDEARAKRQASLANPFDLQASLEKIAKFEDRWRVANRPIYYPSCLAGALFERRPPPVEGASS